MNKYIADIQNRFRRGTIIEQLIFINILVFILTYIFKAIASLMQLNEHVIFDWLSLPARSSEFFVKPWTLITYGFLHGDFFHILFNLIVLFYIGNLFLNFFSKRDFLIYYFLGIAIGGIFYLLSYNYFPALKAKNSFLVGASAGVTSILVGLATKIPNYGIQFRFIGSIKLWHIAVAFIILDIVQIPISNTGGHLAHLGGALTGFLLTYFSSGKKGASINLENLFKWKTKSPLKTVYKKPKSNVGTKSPSAHQGKIDEILDKISKSGYETLSPEEKDFLFKVGKK